MRCFKFVFNIYLFLLVAYGYAQETSLNSTTLETNYYQVASGTGDLNSLVDSLEFICTGNNNFYAFNMLPFPAINEYELINNNITFTGNSIPYFGSSLSISNNLSTGSVTPTLYSANFSFIKYWSGTSWVQESNVNGLVNHGAGFGNIIYYLDNIQVNPTHIFRYDGVSTTVFKTINKFPAVPDLAVDNLGNIYFFGKDSANVSDSLYVINPNGQIIQQHPLVVNVQGAYGAFLLNGVLYYGFTISNPFYGNQLLPVTFSASGVVPGTPLSFPPGHTMQWDLASCDYGFPLGTYNNDPSFNFTLYPNPASTTISIQFQKDFTGEINIRDLNGKLYRSSKSNEDTSIKLDVSNLQSGVYLLEFYNTTTIARTKFVKL